MTATSGRSRSCISESGSPIWLFKFPLFLTTRKRPERNSAIASFVVVFPALPVIATTLVPLRPPHRVRQLLQRPGGVVDLDNAATGELRGAGKATLDDRAARALSKRLFDEVMRVEAETPERDKEVSRLQRPAVADDVPDCLALTARPDAAADRLGYPPQREAKLLTQPAT